MTNRRGLALILIASLVLLGCPCDEKVRPFCESCVANPAGPGCAQLIASGACSSCVPAPTPPPPTTSTTTQPPAPTTTTTTTTTMPAPQPTPTPPPQLAGCKAPQGVEWSIGPITTTRARLVNEVMKGLTGCEIGSDCRHGSGAGDAGAQKWMNRVIYEIRAAGICAGQHIAGSEELRQRRHAALLAGSKAFSTGTDEIAVAVGACDGFWEGYKIANFGGGKVIWAIEGGGEGPPGANRRSWTPTSGCSATPPPTPSPSPGPTPTPEPSPGACPVTSGMLDTNEPFRADVKPQPGNRLDLTLWACGSAVVATLRPDVPACLNFCCPLEGDKSQTVDLDRCADELWGKAKWSRISPAPPALGPIITPTANTNTIVLSGSVGEIKICGSAVPEDLSKTCWSLHVTPPGCDPSSLDATKCQKNRR